MLGERLLALFLISVMLNTIEATPADVESKDNGFINLDLISSSLRSVLSKTDQLQSNLSIIDGMQADTSRQTQEIPESVTSDTWQNVADKYLCSSGHAANVRDALTKTFPGYLWYVLVQDSRSGTWAVSHRGEFYDTTKCERNMFVWRAPSLGKQCSEKAKTDAQTLVDYATDNFDTAVTIKDSIKNRESQYGLEYYIVAAWEGATELSSSSIISCHVTSKSVEALYYIYSYSHDPTTTPKSTTKTTKKTTTSETTKRTTTSIGWEDLADSELCSSGRAQNILGVLDESFPGMDWYVFVQNTRSNWTGSLPGGESHQTNNLCQKNMVVWRQTSTGNICSNLTASAAESLINNATDSWNQAQAMTDFILEGEAEYGLAHDLTASWDDESEVTDWAAKVESSCHVHNNRTVYYISTSSASVGPFKHVYESIVCTILLTVSFMIHF